MLDVLVFSTDGPPFATGLPHYGHILAGTIKDVVTRYATQTGHYVTRRFVEGGSMSVFLLSLCLFVNSHFVCEFTFCGQVWMGFPRLTR